MTSSIYTYSLFVTIMTTLFFSNLLSYSYWSFRWSFSWSRSFCWNLLLLFIINWRSDHHIINLYNLIWFFHYLFRHIHLFFLLKFQIRINVMLTKSTMSPSITFTSVQFIWNKSISKTIFISRPPFISSSNSSKFLISKHRIHQLNIY